MIELAESLMQSEMRFRLTVDTRDGLLDCLNQPQGVKVVISVLDLVMSLDVGLE